MITQHAFYSTFSFDFIMTTAAVYTRACFNKEETQQRKKEGMGYQPPFRPRHPTVSTIRHASITTIGPNDSPESTIAPGGKKKRSQWGSNPQSPDS
jgi:hypothetical protein